MLRINEIRSCCSKGGRHRRTLASFSAWFVPSAFLLLVPKCPLCIVAYTAALTGLGISVSTATGMRVTLILSCISLLAFVVLRTLLRVRRADIPNPQTVS